MFLSASRRTDIPALYGEWLSNRFSEGYIYVRNPMNIHHISKILLSPLTVDGIVFWTKNATNFLPYLNNFQNYPFYFQYTVNPYNDYFEKELSNKQKIINNFKTLSKIIGKKRVIWRYDPIILSSTLSINFHINSFEYLCSQFYQYTNKCVISFLDLYKKCERNMVNSNIQDITVDNMMNISRSFHSIATKYNITIETCGEKIDLDSINIIHGKCIDDSIFSSITQFSYRSNKDSNQREECGCIDSIDIGQYNSCINGCIYCYANDNKKLAYENNKKHNPKSPLLIGEVGHDDIIHEREIKTNKVQRELFNF